MKTIIAKTSLASLAALAFIGLQTLAAPAPSDPIGEQFFPPEMLQQAHQEIGLTAAQQEWLGREINQVSARAPELHQRLQREVEALAEVVKPDRVDEAKLLAQLDKVLDAERALKRLQMSTLAAIKNQLTPEQQARLRTWRSQNAATPAGGSVSQAELKTRFEGKIKRIQAAIQQWQESGRDPSAVGVLMQEFPPLMEQGKHKEAEAVLDRALSELGIGAAPKPRAQANPAPRPAPFGEQLSSGPGDSRTTFNFARSIAIDGSGRVHAVWFTSGDGRAQVYYRRSDNSGASWKAETRLSDAAMLGMHPSVAVSGSNVFVVWHTFPKAGKPHIHLRRSNDGGATWKPPQVLCDSGAAAHPSVAAVGSIVHLIWKDTRVTDDTEVYYRRSSDAGATWEPERRLTDAPFISYVPSLAASDEIVALAWVDTRDGNEEEYVKVSRDGGRTWGPDTRMTENRMNSWAPSVAVRGQTIHLAWFDQKDTPFHLYDAEAKLDEALRLVGLAAESPPAGVHVADPEQSAKFRATEKMKKIYTEAPAWAAAGGDQEKLRRLLDEFQDLGSPVARLKDAAQKLDAVLGLLGVTPDDAATNSDETDPAAAIQKRIQARARQIHEAAPRWVQNGGDEQELRSLMQQFEKAMEDLQQKSTYANKELKLDEALRLMNIAFDPPRPDQQPVTFYAEAFQSRVQQKRNRLQAAAPAWAQRGGDPAQLESLLQEFIRRATIANHEWDIYYRRSDDAGKTWCVEQRLVAVPGNSHRPQLAVVGGALHLAWWDSRDGNDEIYYKHSADAGRTWGVDVRVTNTPGESQFPMIAASERGVHVVWTEQSEGSQQVFYRPL